MCVLLQVLLLCLELSFSSEDSLPRRRYLLFAVNLCLWIFGSFNSWCKSLAGARVGGAKRRNVGSHTTIVVARNESYVFNDFQRPSWQNKSKLCLLRHFLSENESALNTPLNNVNLTREFLHNYHNLSLVPLATQYKRVRVRLLSPFTRSDASLVGIVFARCKNEGAAPLQG